MGSDFRGIGMTSQRSRDRLVHQLREMGIRSEQVLELIRNTPRHIFVDEALATRAYDNTALPIGFNQTISQPYIVACMTEALLADGPLDTVLEIGTGCGYQTVIRSSPGKFIRWSVLRRSCAVRARIFVYSIVATSSFVMGTVTRAGSNAHPSARYLWLRRHWGCHGRFLNSLPPGGA